MTYAAHLSLKPVEVDDVAVFAGHGDREKHYTWTGTLPNGRGPIEVLIDGSWACWGTQDQDLEGDDTLHLVVTDLEEIPTREWWMDVLHTLYRFVDGGGRFGDYALLTDGTTWSEIEAVVMLDGNSVITRKVVRP